MTAQLPPWLAADTPQPKHTTREDVVERVARHLLEYPADHQWTDADLAPITTIGPDSHASLHLDIVRDVLDEAYPQVVTAAEIDALPWQTLIVNDQGHARRRVIAPDNHLNHGGKPWSQDGAEGGRHRVGWSSATLALSGPWTVVHRGVAA